MSINVGGGELRELKPRILVIGVGGAGGNAINAMIEAGMQGVEFVAVNTDAQDLKMSKADAKIQIGMNLTKGLGAGAKHDIGQAAADESINEIVNFIQGSNMVFIASGMGGGTGTGASHVIAKAAREMNILTVGVTTLPFSYEGPKRMRRATAGLEELKRHLDTTIVVPNQNLFKIANEATGFEESFSLSNDVLKHGVQSITDLMVRPGMINLDFADVETVMSSSGKAMMGTGEAEGENRAMVATELALNNPLIDEYTLQGAKGLLVNITGGSDIKLFEVDAAVNKIRAEVDPEAELIFGAIKDENMNGKIRVSIVATSLKGSSVSPDSRPVLNVVSGSNGRGTNFSDNLFSKTNIEQNVVNSIDGATALKLDENYEIKNNDEQNAVMDSFESEEENKIAKETKTFIESSQEIPTGVSIESASYMENSVEPVSTDMKDETNNLIKNESIDEEYTPKLFSEEQNYEDSQINEIKEDNVSDQLFDQENNEDEDFEIPAFLRRQKF
ncbi:MAG: cell division protein FtsZ [Pseudomonadota bacterium]|nr:cell division protein FtsZ [Pseudomonadota bacterium]